MAGLSRCCCGAAQAGSTSSPTWSSRWPAAAVGASGWHCSDGQEFNVAPTQGRWGHWAPVGPQEWMLQARPPVVHLLLPNVGQQLMPLCPAHSCLFAASWNC